MIKGVVFDLGSTLMRYAGDVASTRAEADAALAEGLLRSGVPLDREAFLLHFARRQQDYERQRQVDLLEYSTTWVLRETLRDLALPAPGDGDVDSAVRALYAVFERHWQPMPDAHATLQELARAGLRIGLLSNAADEGDVWRLLDQSGFGGLLDPVLISAALGVRKPNPLGFRLILKGWMLRPGEVVMVGDLLEADIRGAQNAGVHNIWLLSDPDNPANAASRGAVLPEASAKSLADIPALVRAM